MISFLMPVFNRPSQFPHLVNEAIYWYIRQDYPNKELIILSHAEGQTIKCNVPGVRVYNEGFIESLGTKMNMLVELAKGEICLPFEDDDISLPWRAQQAVDALVDGYDYWTPGLFWYYNKGEKPVANGTGVMHCCSAYRRLAFLYAYCNTSQGHDTKVHEWAMKNLRCNKTRITDPQQISYFYRWGICNHLSGTSPYMDETYKETEAGPPGEYLLEPVMAEDFVKLHEEAARKAAQSSR